MAKIKAVACLVLAFLTLQIALPPQAAALFSKFGVKDEAELGEKFNVLIRSRMPIIEDPEVVSYIKDLVEKLKAQMPPQPFPIRPSVIKENAINAFAAPAAYLFVNTGLILNMSSEDELVGVLAHECSHITQRHIAKRIEQQEVIGLATMVGMLAGAFLGAATGSGQSAGAILTGSAAAGQTASLSFSRDDEREADQVGLNYLVAAGYNPEGMVHAFEILRQHAWLAGGGSTPSYLQTHPGVDERIGYLAERIKRLPPELSKRTCDNTRFLRVQTIIRARFLDQEFALPYYERPDKDLTCQDKLGQGIIYSRLNRMSQAKEAFEKALSCARTDPLVLREAGRFYFQTGDFATAGKLLQEASLRNPDDLMALFFYARLLGESGQMPQATQYMERILQRLPEDPEIHSYIGRYQGQSGNLFQAHLHLTYAAIYSNNKGQTRFHMEKAKAQVQTEDQRRDFEKLERVFRERSEYW